MRHDINRNPNEGKGVPANGDGGRYRVITYVAAANARSLAQQTAVIERYCESKGLTIGERYLDRFETNGGAAKPRLADALLQAGKDRYDIMIVCDLASLAVDKASLTDILSRLSANNVKVETVFDEIVVVPDAPASGRVSPEVARRREARRRAFASGLRPCEPVWGYRSTPEGADRHVIDPVVAGDIRRIFAEAVDGITIEEIANRLKQEGLLPIERTPAADAIAGILADPIYGGFSCCDLEGNAVNWLPAGSDPTLTMVHVPHLQIVDLKVWVAAQSLRQLDPWRPKPS